MLIKVLKKKNFSLVSFIASLIIVFSLFGDAYFVSQYGINLKLYGIVFFVIFSMFNYKKIIKSPRLLVNITLISFILLVFSSPFWYSTRNAYSYAGVLIAFLVYSGCKKEFFYLIKGIFYITLILASYEFVTAQYLFDSTWIDSETGNQIILDKEFIGGRLGVFRSKALFFGPLSLGLFVISFSLLNPTKIYYLLLSFLIAFFSGSRLAQLVIIILILNAIYQNRKYIKHLVVLSLLMLASVGFNFFSNANFLVSLERSFQVFDVTQPDNLSRLNFWIKSINLYFDYSLINLFFGDNGRFYSLYFTGNESGWLSLFIDNGLVGFIFYFVTLLYAFRNDTQYSLKPQTKTIILVCLIFVMTVITFHLSAINNLFYWLIIFIHIERKRNCKIPRHVQ